MTIASTTDPLVGRVLDGRYEIISRIARGGMATVYVATDTRLARTVAIKVMHEGLGDDRDFTRKFDREARAAARLIHPHVVAVFDQGADAGRPYIVMEYVAGQTLRSVISREAPLSPQRALDLMEPILQALAVAHDAGLVHRDIKPENVLISDRGHVKVADFGLAKAISGDTVTATQGLLIGTVSYIPPELVAEGAADARSDVYSAGIVLFEMLTGRKPHTGDTPIQVAYAHCNKDVPPPSSLQPGIPAYLDALVQTATARDPQRRPRDGRFFLDQVRLARQALEQEVTDDAALTMQLRRSAPDEPTVALADLPLTATTTTTPTPHRWQPRPRQERPTPVTPISPVDIDTTGPQAFYDALPKLATTPVERSLRLPKVVAKPVGATRVRVMSSAKHRRRRGLVALLVLLLATLASGFGGWWLLAGQFAPMPELAGQGRDAAFATAQAAKLTVSFDEEYSEDVAAGIVIRTTPDAGTKVKPGSNVHAFLSKGPERYDVPKLVGMTESLAVEAIKGANLVPGTIGRAYHETVAAGQVIDQSVAAGTAVKKSTTVDLTISKGPAPISVPQVTGKTADEAKATLTKLGLKWTIKEDNSKTVPKGSVIAQDPATGELHRGDTVTLTVSKGPVMVTVPNTRLMSEAKAKQTLQDAGFVVAVKNLPNPLSFGMVSYSDPAGGTQAPQGSTVTIYIA